MINDINGIGNQPHRATQKADEGSVGKASGVLKKNAYSTQTPTQGEDSIQLSNLAKRMPELEEKARTADGVDPIKVKELKDSIENYKVDPESLASSMIQSDSQL